MATSKYNIAGLKEAQGELEEARSLFLECEQIYANVVGVDHEETLDAAIRPGLCSIAPTVELIHYPVLI